MGFFLKLILVAIFFYLIYQIVLKPLLMPKDPFRSSKNTTIHDDPHIDKKTNLNKKIDMSDVEDADYKELD
ncbi:MAG: hypothetical protein WCT23_02445 [Candidatus Neomarinimicrobiota bacterium]|jgi:hypothetical protein